MIKALAVNFMLNRSRKSIKSVCKAIPMGNDKPIFSVKENLTDMQFTKAKPNNTVNIIPVYSNIIISD